MNYIATNKSCQSQRRTKKQNNKRKEHNRNAKRPPKTATKSTSITPLTKATQNAQKETKTNDSGKRKYKQSPNETFLSKSSLQQSKLPIEKHQNKSFIRINEEEIIKSPKIEVITLTSDSAQNSQLKVYTSDNKYDFMVTSPNSPDIPTTFTSKILTPKTDKAVKKIQQLNATPMTSNSPIEKNAIPCGTTQTEETSPTSIKTIKTPIENTQAPNPEAATSQKQTTEALPKGPQEHNLNEEHYIASAYPSKSSISDIKPGDFHEEELQD